MADNRDKANIKRLNLNHYSSNLDVHIIEKLSSIIENSDDKYEDLLKFVLSGNLTKILSNWSQLSSTNNHSQFIELSVKLSKVTYQINLVTGIYNASEPFKNADVQLKMLELKPMIMEFYTDLLKNNLKVIYRALNSGKPSLTNPVLRILSHLLEYHPTLANEFINCVDLNSNIFPKLLIPSKQEVEQGHSVSSKDHLSIRYNFIKFWLKLNSIVPNYTRKDLLTNYYKIMNNLWKYMNEIDSFSTLKYIITFIDQKILNEGGFKRSTKCKILNDNFMFKVLQIFNRLEDDQEFNKTYINFLNKISTDSKEGLIYINDKLWQESHLNGVSIQANGKTFRINNKLIFTLLTSLKPWDSNTQIQLVLNVLEANPELVAPYMNWTVQNGGGYHDPNLTSWWIGHTLLFSKIIQLPLPKFIAELEGRNSNEDIILNNKLILESISLAPLSKSSLIKCIESKNGLVKQLTFQLIYFMIQKLEKLLKLDIVQNKQELTDLVFGNFPDLTIFIQAYNSLGKDSKSLETTDLTRLTIVMIMNSYSSLYPNNASSLAALSKITNVSINEIINNDVSKCTGFELVLLDNFLSIQSNGASQQDLKWWNKTKDGNSFFTSLIKLSVEGVDRALTWKIHNLLIKLTEGRLLFNRDLIVSPLSALIISLKDEDNIHSSLWDLLDEVVSRSIRTPYKYLDLSHQKYNDISIFVVVLLEQTSFLISKDKENVTEIARILFNILRRFISIGEPKEAIFDLLEEHLYINSDFKKICVSNKYTEALEFKGSIQEKSDNIMDITLNKSNDELNQNLSLLSVKIPTSNLELASVLWRLKLIVTDDSSQKFDNLIVELISKIGNYLLSILPNDLHIVKFVLSRKFWESLIPNENEITKKLSRKIMLVGELLSEVFKQLPKEIFTEAFMKYNELNSKIYNYFISDFSFSQDTQVYISKFCWVLTDEQCLELVDQVSNKNVYLLMSVYQTVSLRELILTSNSVAKLLRLNFTDDTLNEMKELILTHILEKSLVSYSETDLMNQVDEVLNNSPNHYLLKSFVIFASNKKFNLITYLTEKSETISDEYFLCYIGYVISIEPTENMAEQKLSNFIKKVTGISLKFIQNGWNDKKLSWNQLLTLLRYAAKDSSTDLSLLQDGLFAELTKRGFKQSAIPEFAALIFQVIESVGTVNDRISKWIHKSMLYITKKYAELDELSINFESFVSEMKNIIHLVNKIGISIWKIVPITIINTQLEALLNHKKWIKKSLYLEFSNSIIMTGLRNIIKYDRLIQIFINNEENTLNLLPTIDNSRVRFQSALLLHNIFNIAPKSISTSSFMERVILFYLGSSRAEDLLLKSVLKSCEANLTQNWMNKITNWEFVEELKENDLEIVGEERLILKEKSNYTVSINKNFVKNSITSVVPKATHIPESLAKIFDKNTDIKRLEEELNEFYGNNVLYIDQSYQNTVYDSEFILMLIIHNDELVKFSKEASEENRVKYDIKNLIDSHLLQLIVFNISKPNEGRIASILLSSILNSLTDYDFKDKNIFKIYICNILNTIRKKDLEITSLIWQLYSNLIPILANPGHFLYEKTFRYVLSHPIIKANELPLFSEIILSKKDKLEFDTNDTYYKELTWLLESLVHGIQDINDLNVIKFKGVLEWMLNLLNSPYLTNKTKSLIMSVLYVIQNIDQGSDLLISRFAILTCLEQYYNKLQNEVNVKNTELFREFHKLNIDELTIRFGITAASGKRIREWSANDIPNYVKRIHTS